MEGIELDSVPDVPVIASYPGQAVVAPIPNTVGGQSNTSNILPIRELSKLAQSLHEDTWLIQAGGSTWEWIGRVRLDQVGDLFCYFFLETGNLEKVGCSVVINYILFLLVEFGWQNVSAVIQPFDDNLEGAWLNFWQGDWRSQSPLCFICIETGLESSSSCCQAGELLEYQRFYIWSRAAFSNKHSSRVAEYQNQVKASRSLRQQAFGSQAQSRKISGFRESEVTISQYHERSIRATIHPPATPDQ